MEYIIKKRETLTTIALVYIYIIRTNNILVFKIKHGYKLELETSETMNLFHSIKKLIDQTKHSENVPSLKVGEAVLVQYNLVDNKCQKNLKYYTFLLQVNLMLIC